MGLVSAVRTAVGGAIDRPWIIDWKAGGAHRGPVDVDDLAKNFSGVVREPPHELSSRQAADLLPLVERAIDESAPHILMTRGVEDVIRMLEEGGPIGTAFTKRQRNPFAPRGLAYLWERLAREKFLGIHGNGARAGHTVYAEVAFQPPGTPLPGPRPDYGSVAMVFPRDAAMGASILHRDSFSVLERDAVGGIENLADVVLRSKIGEHAIAKARNGEGRIDLDRFATEIRRQLDEREHGIEQYIEAQLRPVSSETGRPFRVENMAEIRILEGAPETGRLTELATKRGIPVRVVRPDV